MGKMPCEQTLSSQSIFSGKIIKVRKDDVKLENGLVKFREVVEHPGGVVIVALTDDDKIIFVRQWRYPLSQELIELPAGKLEPPEDPFITAKRELQEETGYVAAKWEKLGVIYSSPGFCNEKLYIYKATDLTFTNMSPDEDENIITHEINIKEAMSMIKSGEICDAKTIAAISLAMQVGEYE